MVTPLPDLLHQDASVLAFAKPSGLAVQGGSGLDENLEGLVAQAFGRRNGKSPRLVHRLDRDTSGVILFARTKPAAAFLSAAFAERRVSKRYLAIVCGGAPDPAEGEIATPLLKIVRDRVEMVRVARSDERGAQAALTRYACLAQRAQAALMDLAPETGRMHQLRVHLASMGRPIAGDGKYGGFFEVGGVRFSRVMLHAASIAAPHPAGGILRLSAPAPADFHAACAALGLEDGLSGLPRASEGAT